MAYLSPNALAARSGALSVQELALIRSVSGYSRKEGKRIDEQRQEASIPQRRGHKKQAPVTLTKAQADALLMGLLLDLGLSATRHLSGHCCEAVGRAAL